MKRADALRKGVFVLAFSVLLVCPGTASASPQPIITWQAGTYAPPGFLGRTFPTAGSVVRASVALIDGGSLRDLSREDVQWYANGELIASGRGMASVAITAPAVVPTKIDLRVQLPGYGTGELLARTVEIPVVRPEAVVVLVPAESEERTLTFAARPYFFNVRSLLDLSYAWSVSGASSPTPEDPQKLSIVLAEDDEPASVNLTVKNPMKLRESASRFFSL